MTLIEDFTTRREERLRKKWSQWQPRNPNPSDLTDCPVRYQVMRVACWESRPLPDIAAMEMMEDGQLAEEHVIRQMQDEGWKIVQQQAPFEIMQPIVEGGPSHRILTGKLDGKLHLKKNLQPPLEVKNTADWTFERISEWQDLLDSPWTRKWYRQMQSYCLGYDSEVGYFALAHRGKRKMVEVPLDWEFAEDLLQSCIKAVDILSKLQTWETPASDVDRALTETYEIPFPEDFNVCRDCWCSDRCCFPPEPAVRTAQIREDLSDLAAQYAELHPKSREFEKVKKQLKAATEGFPQTVAGDFVIEGKVGTRRFKEQPARGAYTSESWQINVRKAGE